MKAWQILILFPVLRLCSLPLPAQRDTLHLQEVKVVGSQPQGPLPVSDRLVSVVSDTLLRGMPVMSLQEALLAVPGVDIRQRGPEGVQADLSLRGGTFDQVLVMIDGIKVSDPQTGHHDLNVPVPLSAITSVEVLKGGASRLLGPDAFAGAVNLVTALPQTSFLSTDVTFGQHGYYNAGIDGGGRTGLFSVSASLRHSASAGYRENTDFAITQMFLRGHYGNDRTSLDLLGGWLDKGFGANGFYSPAFPDQYERYRSGLGALRFTSGRRIRYEQSVYWRRGRDEFRLFRNRDEAPSWYKEHNYHRTDITGTELKVLVPERFGRTTVGLEVRQEAILSNVLGEPSADSVPVHGAEGVWYDHRKRRNIFSLYADQRIHTGPFSASAGALLNRTGDYDWKLYGGLDMGYRVGQRWRFFAAINQSLRYPTFTELYYHSPVNRGNAALLPEEALTAEAGIRKEGMVLAGKAGLFYRRGSQLIDWIRITDTLPWLAMNHTRMNTLGAEFSGQLDIAAWRSNPAYWLLEIRFSYAFATADKESNGYLSKYAMDYLHHQAALQIRNRLPGGIEATWQFILRDRAGSYQSYPSAVITPYKPYFLANVRISYHIWMMRLFVDISNIFNTSYVDIGNLPMPGIWVKGGVKLKLEAPRPTGEARSSNDER